MPPSLEGTFKWKMEHGKYPSKEDLYQHYITENMGGEDVCAYYHFSTGMLKTLCNYYGIKKDKTLQMALARKKWIEHYGTDAPMRVAAIRAKSVATCQKKYGTDMALQNPEIKEKARQTCLEHFGTESALASAKVREKGRETLQKQYGVDNYAQTEEYQKKIRETCQQKYGVDNVFQTQEVKDKSKETCLKKYGEEHYSQTQEYLDKVKDTCMKHFGTENALSSPEVREKGIQTCQQKYGVDHYSQTEECRQKTIKTSQERYGVDCPLQSKEVKEKGRQTSLQRYGSPTYCSSEQGKEQIRETCRKKYGYDRAAQAPVVREAIAETCMEKYGVPNAMQDKGVQEKLRVALLQKYKGENLCGKALSDETIAILSDKEKLKMFITGLGKPSPVVCASKLECGPGSLMNWVTLYGYRDLLDFTHMTSQYETVLKDLLTSWGVTIDMNNRSILSGGYEIDVYAPNEKIGIEFNGSYWHSEPVLKTGRGEGPLYHQKKSLDAESKGIQLFHIFEYQWNDPRQKPIIISRLKNLFHKDDRVIYGRETEIRDVPDDERKAFLDANHMQGSDHATRAYGLYCNGELVSIMTFCKPRFNKNYQWELSRFCSKCGCSVVGGASKLFKHFLENNEGSVLSYSDIATASGGLYGTLGFRLLSVNRPSYIWWKTDYDYKSRFQCQMKNERQVMTEAGYARIFDAGTKTWVLDR
jgi:hypothetical protein